MAGCLSRKLPALAVGKGTSCVSGLFEGRTGENRCGSRACRCSAIGEVGREVFVSVSCLPLLYDFQELKNVKIMIHFFRKLLAPYFSCS